MLWNTEPTYTVEICIAGDADVARQVCREHCFSVGLCVTVTPTAFIYTGGEEAGVVVRLLNYPRFPSKPEQLWDRAMALGETLRLKLCQHTFLLVAPDKTEWFNRRDENLAAK